MFSIVFFLLSLDYPLNYFSLQFHGSGLSTFSKRILNFWFPSLHSLEIFDTLLVMLELTNLNCNRSTNAMHRAPIAELQYAGDLRVEQTLNIQTYMFLSPDI
jgi:hypothetical protein